MATLKGKLDYLAAADGKVCLVKFAVQTNRPGRRPSILYEFITNQRLKTNADLSNTDNQGGPSCDP